MNNPLETAIKLLSSAHVATDLVWERHDCVEALKKLNMQERTWVDLTQSEIGVIFRAGWANNMDYAEAIQAKLKEKNT
jgi:hypothetical protein